MAAAIWKHVSWASELGGRHYIVPSEHSQFQHAWIFKSFTICHAFSCFQCKSFHLTLKGSPEFLARQVRWDKLSASVHLKNVSVSQFWRTTWWGIEFLLGRELLFFSHPPSFFPSFLPPFFPSCTLCLSPALPCLSMYLLSKLLAAWCHLPSL